MNNNHTDTELMDDIYDDIVLNELMEEGMVADVGHVVLDLAGIGFDLLGGQGGWFDAVNVIWYAKEKNYLYAALSLVSVIPIAGDILGKGGKYIHMLDSGRKVGAGMYKTGKVMKSAKTVSKISRLKSIIKSPKFKTKANEVFELAKRNKQLAPHVDPMKTALDDFAEQETMTT